MARHIKKYTYSSQRTADEQAGILQNPYVAEINGDIDYNSQTLVEDPNFKSYFWVDRIADSDSYNFVLTYNPEMGTLYYSTDTGDSKTWTEYTEPITISGKTFMKRNVLLLNSKIFTTTSLYKIGGNIFSIAIGDDYLNPDINGFDNSDRCNNYFKGDTNLYDASALVYNFIYKIKLPQFAQPANSIFSGCTSLVSAPSIFVPPYEFGGLYNTYRGCTSLTNGGEIVVRNPKMVSKLNGIYRQSSVTTIKCLVLGTNLNAGSSWVAGVPASGTFIKNKNSTWTTGNNGIPTGWTVVGE